MRIVAGSFRGRKLRTPSGMATRPTTERVREALFNVLGDSVAGASVLDCYAGSGALGIEALSRGAARAAFVELGREALAVVRANLGSLALLGTPRAVVVPKALERSVQDLKALGPFDLWLVDPPFALVRDGTAARTLSLLSRAGLLSQDGIAVVEFPSDQACPQVEGLHATQVRPYGDSRLVFLASGDAPP